MSHNKENLLILLEDYKKDKLNEYNKFLLTRGKPPYSDEYIRIQEEKFNIINMIDDLILIIDDELNGEYDEL